jgi:lipopolysaccharide export system protein LptA
MHKATILKAVVITGLLALAISAYAANTITLDTPAMLNGKQLQAGQYQVKVTGSGDVTLLQGKIEVATAKAKLEDRGDKARYNTVVTKASEGSAVPSITEIQFEGKKQALVFDNMAQASNGR